MFINRTRDMHATTTRCSALLGGRASRNRYQFDKTSSVVADPQHPKIPLKVIEHVAFILQLNPLGPLTASKDLEIEKRNADIQQQCFIITRPS